MAVSEQFGGNLEQFKAAVLERFSELGSFVPEATQVVGYWPQLQEPVSEDTALLSQGKAEQARLRIYHRIRDTWESWLLANPGTLRGSKFKSRLMVANLQLLLPRNLGAGPCPISLEGPSCFRPSEGT